MELKKTIDFKEAACQETAMHAAELSKKLEQCRHELAVCLEIKANVSEKSRIFKRPQQFFYL